MLDGVTVLLPRTNWRRATPGRRCRAGAGGQGPGCGRPALLELNRRMHRSDLRKVFDAWWGYCAKHTYGHVLLDDGVYYPIAPRDEDHLARLLGVAPLNAFEVLRSIDG